MYRISASDKYQKMWENSPGPRLRHIIQMTHEDNHPRVLHSPSGYLELVLIIDGETKYSINSYEYQVQKGDLLVFNSGCSRDEFPCDVNPVKSYKIGFYDVNISGLAKNCLVQEASQPVRNTGEHFGHFKALCELLWQQQSINSKISNEMSHYLAKSLFLLTETLFSKEDLPLAVSDSIPLATRVKDYLDEHFTQELSLHFLSKKFNISPYYLAHIFKKQFNYSPVQYILRRRIGYAQTLLITTDLSIGDISKKAGYNNPSHFNLLFTKNVGIAPRKYRMNYNS